MLKYELSISQNKLMEAIDIVYVIWRFPMMWWKTTPVDVPNILLSTFPTLYMDFDFIPSHNDLGSDLDISSPSRDRNKIYDPGICIEVEST
ncbi:hypothetical protein Tco_0588612 [Tanacetum coccineum]